MQRQRNHLIWVGLLITLIGAVSYFGFFARFPALRDFPWINLPLVALGAGLSVVAAARAFRRPEQGRGRVLGALGLVVSLLVAGLFAFYVFYLSYQLPAPTTRATELVEAPGFALAAADGSTVRLEDYRGRKVVLVFYRGFW